MARIERYTSTTPVPIEQAQLQTTVQNTPFIDANDFRFSRESAQALQQVGGVLEELGKRKQEMQDRIGISNINAIMDNAEREYQKEIIKTPLDKHAFVLQRHRANATKEISKQKLSREARDFANNKMKIWGDTFSDQAALATIKAYEKEAIIKTTADYEKALTEDGPMEIAESEMAWNAQAAISYTPTEAEIEKEKIHIRAIKGIVSNFANQGLFEQARTVVKESKGLSVQEKNSLNSDVGKAEEAMKIDLKEQATNTITSVVVKKENLKNKTSAERRSAVVDLKQELVTGGVRGDELEKWFGILDKFVDGTTEEYDDVAYSKLSAIIDIDPKKIGVNQSQAAMNIYSLVGKGEDGGITTTQAQELVRRWETNIDDTNATNTTLHTEYQGMIDKLYNGGFYGKLKYVKKGKAKGEKIVADYIADKTRLTVWANQHKEATPKEFEDFAKSLTKDKVKSGIFSKIKSSFNPIKGSPLLNIGKIGYYSYKLNQLKKLKLTAETIQSTKEIGNIVEVKGQQWRLIKKGETPDKDIYEKVE